MGVASGAAIGSEEGGRGQEELTLSKLANRSGSREGCWGEDGAKGSWAASLAGWDGTSPGPGGNKGALRWKESDDSDLEMVDRLPAPKHKIIYARQHVKRLMNTFHNG